MAISDDLSKKNLFDSPQSPPAKGRHDPLVEALFAKYLLTFRDSYSGRSITDTFLGRTSWGKILDRLEREGVLSFPQAYYAFPEKNLDIRTGRYIGLISGLRSGATIDLDIYQAADEQLQNHPNFRKSYPLVFYRMVDNICVQKIEFLCYGFELPSDVIRRIRHEGRLSYHLMYDMLYWPDNQGNLKTVDNCNMGQPVPLCAFDPEPGRTFILQESKPPKTDNLFMEVLYGCPAAAMPEQERILQQCSVDILQFD